MINLHNISLKTPMIMRSTYKEHTIFHNFERNNVLKLLSNIQILHVIREKLWNFYTFCLELLGQNCEIDNRISTKYIKRLKTLTISDPARSVILFKTTWNYRIVTQDNNVKQKIDSKHQRSTAAYFICTRILNWCQN